MKYVVFTMICLFAVFSVTSNVWAVDEVDKEGIAKCAQLALTMFSAASPEKHKFDQLGKPRNVTNIESELPPV